MAYRLQLSKDEKNGLAGNIIFQGLTQGEAGKIISICRASEFSAGDVILEEGGSGRGIYFILLGEVLVHLPAGIKSRKTEINLNRLQSGMQFGEYSLVDHRPVSAEVKATRPTRVALFSEVDFKEIAELHPRIGMILFRNILRIVIERLRGKDEELESLVQF